MKPDRCTTLTQRPSAPLSWRKRYLLAVRDAQLDTRQPAPKPTRKPRRKTVTA